MYLLRKVSPPMEHIQGGQWWTRCVYFLFLFYKYILLLAYQVLKIQSVFLLGLPSLCNSGH
jgi:hypothetical protein